MAREEIFYDSSILHHEAMLLSTCFPLLLFIAGVGLFFSAEVLCPCVTSSLLLSISIFTFRCIFIFLFFSFFAFLFISIINKVVSEIYAWKYCLCFACVPLKTPMSSPIYQSCYSCTEKTNQTIPMEMCSHISAVGQDRGEKSYYTCLSFSVFFTLLWRKEGKAPISTPEKKNPNKPTKIPKHHCIKKVREQQL